MNIKYFLTPLDNALHSLQFLLDRQKEQDQGIPAFLQQIIAFAGLLVLWPLLLLFAVAIRLESQGPALYSQARVGLNGKHFTIYKFRSMYLASDPKYVDPSLVSSDREGACKKLYKDPRITKVGKIIRKLSIDELPQLWNVVCGEMMLVGPRPALPSEVSEYDRRASIRLQVIPGLTGLWQVSGRADTTFEEQINLDIRYVKQQSFLFDVKILLMTIPAVIFGKGAY